MQSASSHVQGGATYQYTTGPLFQGPYDVDDSDFRLLAECLLEGQAFDDGRVGARGVTKGMTKSSVAKAPSLKKNNMAKSVSIDRGKSQLEFYLEVRASCTCSKSDSPPRHTHTLLAPTPGAESVDGDDDRDDFGDDDFEGDFDDDGEEGYMMEGEDGSIEDPNNPHSGAKKYRRKRIRERQDQVDRRRERNRVLARKTRLRKKFFFESLQQQVTQLTSENDMLKGIVKNKLDSKLRSQILSECPSELRSTIVGRMSGGGGMGSEDDGGAALVGSGTPRGDTESPTSIGGAIPTVLQRADFTLITAIQNHQRSFVITDPNLPDNPIIFASQGFLDLCGFKLEEVLGRNCRFMQSPNADASQVAQLRDGIFKGKDVSACILNRKADGTEFYNQVFVAALHDGNGRIANFVGVQLEVSLVFPCVRVTCLH